VAGRGMIYAFLAALGEGGCEVWNSVRGRCSPMWTWGLGSGPTIPCGSALIGDTCLASADGHAERIAALAMIEPGGGPIQGDLRGRRQGL
jgi:hypothetical protein